MSIKPQSSSSLQTATLIAHRGYSGRYPENTLLAYQAAYACGCRWYECDIQLTADLVPIVHHDESLLRMTGADIDIRTIAAAELAEFSAYHPERFAEQFIGNRLIGLNKLIQWLSLDQENRLFVEIKQHSIDSFGLDVCMEQVWQAIQPCQNQCIIISFNDDIVELAKTKYQLQNGWVIPKWSDEVSARAQDLNADFMFSSKKIMPSDSSQWWQSHNKQHSWHWANYNVDKAEEVPMWIEKGLQYIETNYIGELMQQQNLQTYRK